MPRRKKKGQAMPPLQFVETPVEQGIPRANNNGYFDSACPISARAVMVDELESFHWVSPQFRNRNPTQAFRSRKTTKSFTKLRSRSEGSAADYLRTDSKSKFPPLQFIHQSPSLAQGRRHGQGATLKQRRKYASFCLTDTQSRETACVSNNGPLSNSDIDNVTKSPEESVRKQIVNDEENRQACQSFQNSPLCIGANEVNTAVQSSTPTAANVQEAENFPASKTGAADERCEHCGAPREQFDPTSSQVDTEHNVTFLPCCFCGNNNAVLHCSTPNIDSETNNLPGRWDFCTPPSHSTSVKILAMDTPENDYGLTMRQRQLKYLTRSSKTGKNNMDDR